MISKYCFKAFEQLTIQNKKYSNHIQIFDSWGTFQESFNKFMPVMIGCLPTPHPKKIL